MYTNTRKQHYVTKHQVYYREYVKLRQKFVYMYIQARFEGVLEMAVTQRHFVAKIGQTHQNSEEKKVFPGCPIFSERVTYSPGSEPHFMHM